MKIITHDMLLELHTAVVSAQLVTSRSALLAGIEENFVAGLPTADNPSAQVLEDLTAMNQAGVLADGSAPLAIWLKNAVSQAGLKRGATIFKDTLDRVLTATTPGRTEALCPFPGLQFFDEDRVADFFGREIKVAEALTKLAEPRPPFRWLQIDGPSGAGKSSFARAGILPEVRAGKLAGGPKSWVTAVLRPGHAPIASLAEALVKHAKPRLDLNGRDLDDVMTKLRGSATALASLLREGRPDGHGVLLIIDQLEEVFTLAHADDTAVKQFDALLAAALEDREGPLLLVTTIRSDFVARMGELPALERMLPAQAVRYYLPPMDKAGLRAAIEKPAKRVGLAYEVGLVDRIIEDASTSGGALPLVAHVLQELYQYARHDSDTMTLRAYEALGGVDGALAKSADGILHGLDDDGRQRARKVLLRLVKIGRGTEDIRQAAQREDVLGAAGGGPEAEPVLARLSGGRTIGMAGESHAPVRLVVVSGDKGHERVDLVHEALIQRWETLRDWLKEARQGLELRDDVEEAARIWEASGAHNDGLATGAQLEYLRRAEGPNERARVFLAKSEMLERRRRRRWTLASISIIVLLTGVAAVLFWFYLSKARAEQVAVFARKKTEQRQRALDVEVGRQYVLHGKPLEAAVHLSRAYSSGETSPTLSFVLGRSMDAVEASLARFRGRSPSFSPDGGRLLLICLNASNRRTRQFEDRSSCKSDSAADISVVDSASGKAILTLSPPLSPARGASVNQRPLVVSAAWSPDSMRIASAYDDGTVAVFDASTGRPIVSFHTDRDGKPFERPVGSERRAIRIAWSPDGSYLATVAGSIYERHDPSRPFATLEPVHVWNSLTGAFVFRLEQPKDGLGPHGSLTGSPRHPEASSMSFSRDGLRLVVAGSRVLIWDVQLRSLLTVIEPGPGTQEATFNETGELVLTCGGAGPARLWRAVNGAPLQTFGEEWCHEAAWGPDNSVATAQAGGGVKVWNLDGEPLYTMDWAVRVAFGPNNLVAASRQHDVALLGPYGVELGILESGADWAESSAFSPDGRRLVTSSTEEVRLWSLASRVRPIGSWGSSVLAMSPDGTRFLLGDGEGVRLVDEAGNELARHVSFPPYGGEFGLFSGDSSVAVTMGWVPGTPGESNWAEIWVTRASDGAHLLATETEPTSTRPFIAITHDGRRLAIAQAPRSTIRSSYEGVIRIFDDGVERRLPYPALIGKGTKSMTGAFSVSGDRLLLNGVWIDVQSGDVIKVVAAGRHVVLSPSGQTFATDEGKYWEGGHLKVWGVGGELKGELPKLRWVSGMGRGDQTHMTTFLTERMIVTAEDASARVWAVDGRPLARLEVSAPVTSVAAAKNGFVALGTNTRSQYPMATIWDAAQGTLLLSVESQRRPAFRGSMYTTSRVAFTEDGTMLLIAPERGPALLWNLRGETRPPADIQRIVRCRVPFQLYSGGNAVVLASPESDCDP